MNNQDGEVTRMVKAIQDSPNNPIQPSSIFDTGLSLTKTEQKPSFYNYSNDTVDMAYTTLNSGEKIAKYESYLPETNNEERLAQQQSTGKKWINGIEKLGLKTGTAVLGGTLGVIDSVVEGVAKGSLSDAYNTHFNKWLDDLNVKLDYKLPNYYTEQEKNASFLGQTTQANFWADKVLSGLSFTAGAIVSEALWTAATGGLGAELGAESTLSKLYKWTSEAVGGEKNAIKALNVIKADAKGAVQSSLTAEIEGASKAFPKAGFGIEEQALGEIAESTKDATILKYKVKKLANITGTALRSAGYESGMEARQYMQSTEANWLANFNKEQGREPSAEEYANFKDGLTTAGNWVFAANMGIVGLSNGIQFHNTLFGREVKSAVENSWIERNILGLGFKKAEGGTIEAIVANKAQKIAGKLHGMVESAISESQEEMLQNVVSQGAQNYVLAAYDPKKTKNTYSVVEALGDSFTNTYTSKSGWTEGLVGALVGVLGASVEGATRVYQGGKFNEISEKRENVEKQVGYYNALTSKMHINNVIANNRIQLANEQKDEAKAKGDFTGELLSDRASALAVIERNAAIDNTKEGIKDFSLQMQALDKEELKKELGFDTDEQVTDFKNRKIQEYTDLAKSHEKNLDYAQALLGESDIVGLPDGLVKQNIERAIAYNISMGTGALNISKQLVDQAQQLIAGTFTNDSADAINVKHILELAPKEKQKELVKSSLQLDSANRRMQALQDKEIELSKRTDTTDNVQRANKLLDLQKELIATQNDIERITQERQVAFDALGVENFSDSPVTLEMLDAQDTNVKKLQATLENLKSTDPQKYQNVIKILEEHSKAVQHVRAYDKVTKMINDPNTRIKLVNSWITKLLNKNTKLNEGTEAHFRDILKYSEESTAIVVQESTQREERRKFKAGEKVDKAYIESLKGQVVKGERIDEEDKQILEAEEATISPPTEAQIIEKKIADLEKQKAELAGKKQTNPKILETFQQVFSTLKGRQALLNADSKLAYIYKNIETLTEKTCD